MILSDREIQLALENGHIGITPVPSDGAWSSTAVDLTLDGEILEWKSVSADGIESAVNPSSGDFNILNIIQNHTKTIDISREAYVLEPMKFVLAWTKEQLRLPHSSRIAARVEGKSSLARLGLAVHLTAPTIHAGFGYNPEKPEYAGTSLQLEVLNVGPFNIKLEKGLPICQLILEEVHGVPLLGYSGQFQYQRER